MPSARFQFGVSSLLAAMLIASVAFAALWSWPGALGAVGVIAITMPVAAIWAIGMAHGSRFKRAFCIGAFIPLFFTLVEGLLIASWLLSLPQRPQPEYFDLLKFACAMGWSVAILCGGFSCVVLWCVDQTK